VTGLPKTVTRQRHDCDLNPGPSAPESSTLSTRLPSHPVHIIEFYTFFGVIFWPVCKPIAHGCLSLMTEATFCETFCILCFVVVVVKA